MKRSLPFFFLLLIGLHVSGQCTPNLSCLAPGSTNGVCPSSGLDTGTVGVFYSQVVSVKVPEDGSDFGQPLATIQHVDIVSVDSLAPGLSYTCNPPSCHFPGNSNGCILVSGTPTTAWDHKMTVHAMAYVKILFVNTSQPQTLSGFYSVVENPAGLPELEKNGLVLGQNSPNPFHDLTSISFSLAENAEVELNVYNMLGIPVHNLRIEATKGMNTIELQAEDFSPGIYMYSIGEKGAPVRKMIVAAQ